MHADHDGAATLDALQVAREPGELTRVEIADVAAAVPEGVVQDDVVHGAAVERVVPRAVVVLERPRRGLLELLDAVVVVVAGRLEARHAEALHRTLPLRVELEVVVHHIAQGDADRLDLPEGAPGFDEVGDGLGVEVRGLVGGLNLHVAEHEDGVPGVAVRERLEVEADRGLAPPVGGDRRGDPRRLVVGCRDAVTGRDGHHDATPIRAGDEGERPVRSGLDGGEAVAHADPREALAAGAHHARDAHRRGGPRQPEGGPGGAKPGRQRGGGPHEPSGLEKAASVHVRGPPSRDSVPQLGRDAKLGDPGGVDRPLSTRRGSRCR